MIPSFILGLVVVGDLFQRISEYLILHAPALNIRVNQMMPWPFVCPCTGSG